MSDKGRTGNGERISDNPRRLWSEDDEDPREKARRTSAAMHELDSKEERTQGREQTETKNESKSDGTKAGQSRPQQQSEESSEGRNRSLSQDRDGESQPGASSKDDAGNKTQAGDEQKESGSWKLFEDVLLWAAWLIMVAFNGYAEVFKFNGTTTGLIAKRVNVWIMPAGYVFAIWGVIYIALAVWLVRFSLAGPSRKKFGFLPFTLSGFVFVVTCCLNVAWLIFWHRQQTLVSLIIIAVLTLLVWMLYALVRRDATKEGTPKVAKVLDWAPLSLYASWLSVATLVNAAYAILDSGSRVSDLIQGFTTVIVVGLLLALAFLMMQKLSDWVFGLVIVWACLGIGIRIFSTVTVLGVLVLAMTAIGALIIYFPWNRFKLTKR